MPTTQECNQRLFSGSSSTNCPSSAYNSPSYDPPEDMAPAQSVNQQIFVTSTGGLGFGNQQVSAIQNGNPSSGSDVNQVLQILNSQNNAQQPIEQPPVQQNPIFTPNQQPQFQPQGQFQPQNNFVGKSSIFDNFFFT